MESRSQNNMAHKGMATLFKMNTISLRISDSFCSLRFYGQSRTLKCSFSVLQICFMFHGSVRIVCILKKRTINLYTPHKM